MAANDLLFNKSRLSDALSDLERKITHAIDKETSDYICTVDEERFLEHLLSEFHVNPIILHVEETTVSPAIERQVTIESYGQRFQAKKTFVTFSVPFTGDTELFHLQPNQHTLNPPREVIGENEVTLEIEQSGDAENVTNEFKQRIAKIQSYIHYQQSQITHYNSELPHKTKSAFQQRKAKLIADNQLVASLGFPLKKSGGTTAYSTSFRKKVDVQRPTAGKPAASPHPFLHENHFQEILKTLREMENFMERSPTTFHGLGEEAIRDHFLLALNGKFESTATAETFNFKGKTDILIHHEKRNVFVGECKIWKGEKAFQEAINQLLGYLTWQDTKAALLVFVRDTKISTVLSKISGLLQSHPSFISEQSTGLNSEFRARMKHSTDENIQIHMVVQVYHVPSLKA